MVGEAETLERMARTAKRVVMNFILIDILFLYRLMVEERKSGALVDGGHLYTLERGRENSQRIAQGIRYGSANHKGTPPYGLSRLTP